MPDPSAYWASLVHELGGLPRETGWLEFKHNDAEPKQIGEYVSALANSAALDGRAHGYLVWGIDDAGHAILGTRFALVTSRFGNEELERYSSNRSVCRPVRSKRTVSPSIL